jgi:hypothetical protein
MVLRYRHFTWFYNHYGMGIGTDDLALHLSDLMLDGPVLKPAKSARSVLLGGGSTQPDLSKLFITNLNYFAYRGGYDAIVRLIDPPSSPSVAHALSLSEVLSMTVFVRATSIYFSKKFVNSFLPDFQLAVFRRVNQITNDADLREILDSSPDGMGVVEAIWKEQAVVLRAHWKEYALHETFGKCIACLDFIILRLSHDEMMRLMCLIYHMK